MPEVVETFSLRVRRDTRTGQVVTTGKRTVAIFGEPTDQMTGRAVQDFTDAMSLVAGARALKLTVASNRLMGHLEDDVDPGQLLGMVEYHVRDAYRRDEIAAALRQPRVEEEGGSADGPEGADPAESDGPGTQGREGAG